MTVNASIPGGSTGEVHVPLHQHLVTDAIVESGKAVFRNGRFVPGAAVGVEGLRVDGRFAIFAVGAGDYSFAASV